MDEDSVLFAVRNLFALGNYQIAINELSTSSRLLQSPEAQLEAKIYLYRSYVGQGKYNVVISDVTDQDPAELQAIKLLAVYLQAKEKGNAAVAEQAVSSSTALLSDGANNVNPTIQLTNATILNNEGFQEEALRILHIRGKSLEW
jgi:coatomer protein complex subunit epsilon